MDDAFRWWLHLAGLGYAPTSPWMLKEPERWIASGAAAEVGVKVCAAIACIRHFIVAHLLVRAALQAPV